jgi:hypothetical protein
MDWMDNDLDQIINDADQVGLTLKAITKQPDFAEKYASRIKTINVSVDSLGFGVPWDIAKNLREKFSNVFVRAAIMSPEDIDRLNWVDIITLNHGQNKFYHFPKKEKEELAMLYPDKLCCRTGHCWDCRIKCAPKRG